MFSERKLTHHILHVLARQPEHGFQTAQIIKDRAPGLLDGRESLLYPTLYGLENDGTIESYLQTEEGRQVRYYRLTQKGRGKAVRVEDKTLEHGLNTQWATEGGRG